MTDIDRAIKVMQQAVDEIERLRASNAELIHALEEMLFFYGMDEIKGDLSEIIHNNARAAITKAKTEISKKLKNN